MSVCPKDLENGALRFYLEGLNNEMSDLIHTTRYNNLEK